MFRSFLKKFFFVSILGLDKIVYWGWLLIDACFDRLVRSSVKCGCFCVSVHFCFLFLIYIVYTFLFNTITFTYQKKKGAYHSLINIFLAHFVS